MSKKNWKIKLGVLLMVISVPMFLFIPIVPFLNIGNKTKITITTILIVIAEVTFWSGGLFVGKELFTKYKSYFNPKNWVKKKSGEIEESDIDTF